MVLLLLAGPMAASGTWLLHAHGSQGSHAHRLTGDLTGDALAMASGALEAWGAQTHTDVLHADPLHGDEHTHDSGSVPACQLIEVPTTPLRGPASTISGADRVADLLVRSADFDDGVAVPLPGAAGAHHEVLPREDGSPSGALKVLRSSHALRI